MKRFGTLSIFKKLKFQMKTLEDNLKKKLKVKTIEVFHVDFEDEVTL